MLKIDFWNIAFILVNLLVWYWFVKRFLFAPIAKIIEQRQKLVETDLDGAKQSRDEADQLKQQYEASLAGAKKEADSILDEAHARAEARYSERMAQAQADADRTLADAQKTIALERERSMHELETQISALAMDAAEKVLSEKSGAARDGAAYDSFLSAAGVPGFGGNRTKKASGTAEAKSQGKTAKEGEKAADKNAGARAGAQSGRKNG